MIVFIIVILLGLTNILTADNADLDTVYLQNKAAWRFYAHYTVIINYSRRNNLNILMENDPKARDAFFLIDNLVDDNVNPECITKPLLRIGINPHLIPRYKLHFLQQITGDYYPPGVKVGIDSQVPDNIMFVIDKRTNMLVYMRCTAFEYTDNKERNLQIIGGDVLKIAQINMNDFKRFGYHHSSYSK